MKIFVYILIITFLLANLMLLGYLLAKTQEVLINQDRYINEIAYISQTMENFETDVDLLKKALLYDKNKARILFKKWFKYIDEFNRESK